MNKMVPSISRRKGRRECSVMIYLVLLLLSSVGTSLCFVITCGSSDFV
jgi:hypothetical protein